jgi:hypothetical protein
MNVKRLYEYTVKSFITQASYCCTDVKEAPWILGTGLGSICIWPARDETDIYRIELKVSSDNSGYTVDSYEQYRIFKYVKTKQKRALYLNCKCPN